MSGKLPPTANPARLRTFNEVARAGSISVAARRLGVSQPAVTAQIRALEDDFAVQLFVRTGRGVELTALGRRLFERTAPLRDLEEAATEVLSEARALQVGELTVAAGAPAPAMRIIAAYRDSYPQIAIRTLFGNWQQVVDAVSDRTADVGLLTDAPDGKDFVRLPFLHQRIVALVPADHDLANRVTLSLAELAEESLVFRSGRSLTRRIVEAEFQVNGAVPVPAFEFQTREAIYEAAAAGLGIAFMFEAATSRSDSVRRLPITELPGRFAEHAFCLASRFRFGTIRSFMHLCQEDEDIEP
jgi:molybdate transport repressor ModE-like protein